MGVFNNPFDMMRTDTDPPREYGQDELAPPDPYADFVPFLDAPPSKWAGAQTPFGNENKVEGVDWFARPDFRGISNTLAGAYERAGASGLANARGRLAKMGLGGTGAEVATEAYAGDLAGKSQADLQMKMEMARVDFDTLQQQRKNIYNQAKAAYDQGNYEFASNLSLQYDQLTAEMNARKDPGSGGVLDNVAAALKFIF